MKTTGNKLSDTDLGGLVGHFDSIKEVFPGIGHAYLACLAYMLVISSRISCCVWELDD